MTDNPRLVKKGIYLFRDQEKLLNQHIFDVYRRTGKKPTESSVVRAALDAYLSRDGISGERLSPEAED